MRTMAVEYGLLIATQLIKALHDLVDGNTLELLYSNSFQRE